MKKTKLSSTSEAKNTNQQFAKPEESSKTNIKARNLIQFYENLETQQPKAKLKPSPAYSKTVKPGQKSCTTPTLENERKRTIQHTLQIPPLPAEKRTFQPTLIPPPHSLSHPVKQIRTIRAKMEIKMRKITSFFENVKVKPPEAEDRLRGGEN